MALKVWLPLNGDLRNQGTEEIKTINDKTVLDNNGKIGKCYKFNQNPSRIINRINSTITSSIGTLACWIKLITLPENNKWYCLLHLGNLGGFNTCRLGLYLEYSTKINVSINGSRTGENTYNHSLQIDQWYHLCTTYDGNIIKLYIDGEEVMSKNATVGTYTEIPTSLYIGGTDNYYLNGYMNDIRYYDEALSPLEIKEISKGLMCHLKLDNNGNGLPNLGDFETVARNWSIDTTTTVITAKEDYYDSTFGNTVKVTVGSGSGNRRIYKTTSNVWVQDQIYTVSFWAKAETNGVICNMSRSTAGGNFTEDFTLTTEWKKYVGIITSTGTTSTGTLSFKIVTDNCIVYLAQVKLELGDKATAYQPGQGDSRYSLMRYDSLEVNDCSGFGNNFTRVNDVSYDTNSARNTVCTNFTDQSYFISNQDSDKFLPTEAITVNLWVKFSAFDSPISCAQLGGWSLSPVDGKIRWRVRKGGAYNYYTSITTIESLQDGKWHMLTGIYDSMVPRLGIYIDGVKEKDEIITSGSVVDYNTNNKLFVAAEAGVGATPESTLYVGGISDVRIYATALSADDILELYQTAAKIDSSKNIHTYEIVEDQTSTSITKQGQVKISESNETSTASFDKTNNLKALNIIEL